MRSEKSKIGVTEEDFEHVTKYPCPWTREPCVMFECFNCDVYKNGMKEYHRPPEKRKKRTKSPKSCKHFNIIHPRMDVCPDCGTIHDDFEYMGYFIPDKHLDKMKEYNKKRGNLSELEYRRRVNPEGTVKERLKNGR